ncbi:molybdopterin oxidoreductase family protein [Limisphaera sp. VF-2]|uniref:molybdopterin oxidoreductase family protein n=1 Tax=Limisphaera sp. VF-2 TaxID=3400418 RepID=UPI0030B388BA
MSSRSFQWPDWLVRRDGPLSRESRLSAGPCGLGMVPARLVPTATTGSVCGFCSVGCGLRIHIRDGEPVNLTPDPSYPVNQGMACPKGWEALTPLRAPDRATCPLLRNPETHRFEPVDWSVALAVFTSRFKALMEKHGPESVAVLSTGQICTEEMAFLGALFKFGMGGLHADSNTRQCMATSVVAYKQAFGFDAPPYTFADLEESDVLVFIGANPCIAHPILWQRVMRNPNRPEIVVVDPRTTETALCATQHLALRPKTDLILLYGLACWLIEQGAFRPDFIRAHTSGFEAFAEFVRDFSVARVARETGLRPAQIERCARAIARGRAVSFWWTMGVNQGHQATRTAEAVINLALMTGNIGRPGTGANSITGQCNAMGSRLFANFTSLPAGRDFLNREDREDVARLLNIPLHRIPDRPSLAYDQILDAIDAGAIKGLWVVGTNPVHSWIGRDRWAALLEKLEFLVVQDMYATTETAQRAHLLLPAAGWGEKDGTFINSERRIGLVRKVSRAPGRALPDFRIFQLVAEAWGCAEWFRDWSSPEAVFHILRRLSAGRPCDFSGVTGYRMLERCGGIQWPWPESETRSRGEEAAMEILAGPCRERRLFSDGRFFTPDGRARFWFEAPDLPPDRPDDRYPMVLLTGRGTSAQWHTNTRTGKSEVLRQLYPQKAYVEVNPLDAARLGLRSGERVEVSSRHAAVHAVAFVTPGVQPGQVFMPMHYGETNRLTVPAFDPLSRQPAYKHTAVRLRRAAGDRSGTEAS